MAELTGERDSDRDSLTDWMVVDNSDATENHVDEEVDGVKPDEKVEDNQNEEEEDEEDRSRNQDLLNLGNKVEEVKGDADAESLASDFSYISYEERVRRRRYEKSEATQDEETDLSLASCPSLPDNLPAIKPEAQYVHTPDKEFNKRLTLIVILTLACVLGLGVGHFLGIIDITEQDEPGWSSRSLWEKEVNAAQIISNIEMENQDLNAEIKRIQAIEVKPFKISGKDGRECRQLREEINVLIREIEEMRLTMSRLQFSKMPEADKSLKDHFSSLSKHNFDLRVAMAKLKHMNPEIEELKQSLKKLKDEKEELAYDYASLKYHQPIPQELTGIVRELEGLKQLVSDASKKENPPPTIPFAKSYIAFMSQVFASFNPFHDKNKEIFSQLISKNAKLSTLAEGKVRIGKVKFHEIRQSLATKWEQLKSLSQPENIAAAGISTLNKMNRVIVNVVNKLREIGQNTLVKRGGIPLEKTVSTLSDKLKALSDQFDTTWSALEGEVKLTKLEREKIFGTFLSEETLDEEKLEAIEFEDEDQDEIVEEGSEEEKEEKEEPKKIEIPKEEEKIIEKVDKIPTKVNIEESEAKARPKPTPHATPHQTFERKKQTTQPRAHQKDDDSKVEKDKIEATKPVAHIPHEKTKTSVEEKVSERKSRKESVEAPQESKPIEVDSHKINEILKEEMKDRLHVIKEQQRIRKEQEQKEAREREKEEIKKKFEERKRAKEPQKRKSAQQDNSRFYKGQYNKYKHVQFDDDENIENIEDRMNYLRSKIHMFDDDDDDNDDGYEGHDDDDDDHDDDDDDIESETKPTENTYKGLKRHWEKPQNKKSYFREHSGPKKQFIRRKGN